VVSMNIPVTAYPTDHPERATIPDMTGEEALELLGDGPGYVMAHGFSAYLSANGMPDTSAQLDGILKSWCHHCNTPSHPCPDAVHLRFTPHDGSTSSLVATRCKRSSCPHCGPIYVKQWTQHVEMDLQFWLALDPLFKTYFFTQTWDPAIEPLPFDEEAAHKRVTVLFRDLVRYYRRHIPNGSFEYAVVIEPHRSGQIHIHAFLVVKGAELRPRCTAQHRGGYNRHREKADRLPQGACVCILTKDREPCIGYVAEGMGMGINNLQKLTSSKAASSYVTKRLGAYMSKTVTHLSRPRYARALRMSRGFAVETHGAFKDRIAQAHVRRLKHRGEYVERPPGAWEHRGIYADRRWFPELDDAKLFKTFHGIALVADRARQARPPPQPLCVRNQLAL